MSIKEVRDYHLRMTSDYIELKKTLEQLESEVTPETSKVALDNIENIKKQVARVQENYNRINYIIYLLDMPKRKEKHAKWTKQNQKKLEEIPEKDREMLILKENKAVIDDLNNYIKC